MEALMIVSTVFSVVSSIRGGQQQQVKYEAQATANTYDATVKRQRAETITQVYGQREEQQRRENRLEAGRRRAAIAQSSTGFGGSNADIDNQSELFAELDALNIRYEGQLESKGLLDSATLDDYYAQNNIRSGQYAAQSGYIGAAGAVLSGAADYTRIGARRQPVSPTVAGPYSLGSGSSGLGLRP